MNIYELYIINDDGVYTLDVESIDFNTIFKLENIQDITKREDSITKNFTLKGTKNNNNVLGYLYNLSKFSAETLATNLEPNRKIKCQLFENNIQIISGSLLIQDIEIKNGDITYNCIIVGEVVSFLNDISDRYLHELDS